MLLLKTKEHYDTDGTAIFFLLSILNIKELKIWYLLCLLVAHFAPVDHPLPLNPEKTNGENKNRAG